MTEPQSTGHATAESSARERLLAAAYNIAARQGEQAVTYRSVAARVGVTHGLVRHYFGSREALIDEVMERAAALDAAEVGLEARSVDNFVREFVGVLDASPERQVLQFDFVLSAVRGRIARERATALYDRYIAQVRQTFRNLGISDPDDSWAELVFTILDGLTLQHNLYQDPDRTERILERLRELMEGLRWDGEDPVGLSATRGARFSTRGVTLVMISLRPVSLPSFRLQNGRVMSMRPVPFPEPDPQVAAAVRAIWPRPDRQPLAVAARDKLGGWLRDEDFAAAFGTRGHPGYSPAVLALVTVLQQAENLTDRMAAENARRALDWKYVLGLPLDDGGFDFSVLSEFRARVAQGGLEAVALDALLERLAADGLVKAGGKQRTDSTHVTAAVAALNRLELAGESVRAALEAPASAHPGWTSGVLDESWARRYATPVTSWRPPVSEAKRKELAVAYGKDGFALMEAVCDPASPPWLHGLPTVQVLRQVLLQNYARTVRADGSEVVKRREKAPEGDGLPPGHKRIASPYDTDAVRRVVAHSECACRLEGRSACGLAA